MIDFRRLASMDMDFPLLRGPYAGAAGRGQAAHGRCGVALTGRLRHHGGWYPCCVDVMMKRIAGFALLCLASACAPVPQSTPQPAAAPPAPVALPAPNVPAPLAADWTDRPAAPGDWSYRGQPGGSLAAFGTAALGPQFTMRCERGRILLSHPGTLPAGKSATMTLRSTAGSARHPVSNASDGQPYVSASLSPRDAILDQLIFSRGRFLVQVEGAPDLVLPAWPEIARVVEDCRG